MLSLQVGRGGNGERIYAVAVVILHLYDCEVALQTLFQPVLTVNHCCIFADGKTIDNGDRVHAYKRAIVGSVEDRAVDIVAVRIGTVENDAGDATFGTGLHDIMESRYIGIEAAANILKVEDDDINVGHLFLCRLLILAVEGYYREASLCVGAAFYGSTGFGVASETMFRGENLDNIESCREHCVDKMCGANKRTLVCNDSDILLFDKRYRFAGRGLRNTEPIEYHISTN